MTKSTESSQAASATEDVKLDAFYRDYLEASLPLRPLTASRLGDHRFDHLLDDVSVAARARRVELDRETLERLPRAIDYDRLSRPAQVDFEILRDDLALGLWLEETERRFERDPRVYLDYISDSVYVLLTQSTLPHETNVANALARMRKVPAVIAAARENLTTPPRVVTETAIRQTQGAILFYETDLLEMVGESPLRGELQAEGAKIVAALKDFGTFLESELLPRATGDWRIGRERFAEKLRRVTDAGLTADEVFAEAEAAFVQTRRDMYLVSRQLWSRYFPRTPLPPDDPRGQRDTIRQVVDEIGLDHGRPEDLARDAAAMVSQLKQFITTKDLLRLPEPDRCLIIEMPEFQRGNSVAFLNSAPPLDPSAVSIYAISPPPQSWEPPRVASFLGEYNRQMLQVLTIHEAYPGHYVQLEYANRHPSLIRRVCGSGVYAEGWANYCEQVLLDEGYGDGSLPLRLMQLKFFLRSIANAILDHRMHCTEMSDDEAVRFLTEDAFQGDGEARLKVIRSKQSSVQLSTYFVGRSAFMRLRREIQRDLGEDFDLGRFHEAVLEQGSVPVKYLPELVRRRLEQPR